ncbi:hypothetical protein ATK74_0736 [Propionicimonas paludicola]|uniref:Glycosyltransferase n=1 Tax=Propionicimonas paludicola TaxID=185243 RepID=A0A2A9CP54_9ACTN|nr:glycosyltransferase [Propionicimonas paludicola]PFG16204.1 hypothetical protein ATK74_0736 [Propionicimonas paludicola]
MSGPAHRLPVPCFDHVLALSDRHGIFEHARGKVPRVELGYCTDDVSRALSVVIPHASGNPQLDRLSGTYLAFLDHAVVSDGLVHNRMSSEGKWTDEPGLGDWWGRALGGLGSAARFARTAGSQTRAIRAFTRAAKTRSPHVRSAAFAAIGACDLLRVNPENDSVRVLLADCLDLIPRRPGTEWDWPEPRLRYANGALCDALILGGIRLRQPVTVRHGLTMLRTLLRLETGVGGRLSLAGTGGRGPEDRRPLWDQQPIEAAAIANACLHAFEVTGDLSWVHGVRLAWGWFIGENDSHSVMYEPGDGAGHDGLEQFGHNSNCGAESTLAALSTLQCAIAITAVRR